MPDRELIRERPRSLNAERSVLGAMILSRDAILTASERLTAEDFYDETNKLVFSAIVDLYNEHKNADLVNLQNKLRTMQVPDEVCGLEFLSGLVRSTPSAAGIAEHCEIVAEKSILRQMIKAGEEIEKDCYRDDDRLESILESSEKKIYDIISKRKSVDAVSMETVMVQVLKSIDAASKVSGAVTGVPTGFYELDYMLAGLQKNNLVILAARPAMGKTAFALNIAENTAVKNGIPTAFFSLEMSTEELGKRILSMNSKVDSQAIRRGKLEDNQWVGLVNSASEISKAPLFLNDASSGVTVNKLKSKCRKLKMEHNLGLIIIDYLQLMEGSGKHSGESRQNEISEISRALKLLAMELECPILALSQLSRTLEGRPDKRPMLSDLRESGAIEQDADVVMFIYRDEVYKKDTEDKNIAEIIVSKQRSGPTGTVKLGCRLEMTRFLNLEIQK
ncbi:MAG: replicative DNA helicase [Lachnospiraceae bacterium]|nr:replicative DNA helicase [Lachnospiraceae bacterium]